MTRMKGPWTVGQTRSIYKSSWLDISEDQVIRPDGLAGKFAVVRMKPGVSVLALNDDDEVYLTSEYRYAMERESIEVVSGGIDGNEPPAVAARRELREEVGIEAAQWIDLGSVDPFTSIIHSPTSLFVAKKLSLAEPKHEGTEIIRVIKVKLREAVRMVMESEITHGPSCVLILRTHCLLNSKKLENS